MQWIPEMSNMQTINPHTIGLLDSGSRLECFLRLHWQILGHPGASVHPEF
jgi:hypothetical protein